MKIKYDEPFALDNATRTEYGKKRVYGGGGGGTTTTSSQEIPAELKPLANLYVQQAQNIAQTPYQQYTGQRYADLNPTQNAGIGMVQQRAINGSQTMNNAESSLNGFINGGNTNPYLDAMVQKAQGSVLGNSAALARRSGSFGNSGVQEQALRQIGDVATNMYGNAYGQDQANRLQAISQAPTFGNAPYQDASQLLNVGSIQQQNAQNPLDFQYQQFQNKQDFPFKRLQATGNVVGQSAGTSTTSSGGGK